MRIKAFYTDNSNYRNQIFWHLRICKSGKKWYNINIESDFIVGLLDSML
nr:MAG TPA: hypothetical protein [Caudoviricetes sp.]